MKRKFVFYLTAMTAMCVGPFFEDGDGVFTQSDFSFLIHADWDGEDKYDF